VDLVARYRAVCASQRARAVEIEGGVDNALVVAKRRFDREQATPEIDDSSPVSAPSISAL
jgi:hypothetical protein